MSRKTISLVIFTCEGREHLLQKSFASFTKACGTVFTGKILAVDGKISQQAVDAISPDEIIQSPVRSGYVPSIIRALKNVDTDYFFWLEDDWEFPHDFDVESLISLFDNDTVLQVTLAKENRDAAFKVYTEPDIYINGYGFSANPSLCRTAIIKEIFNEAVAHKKDESSKFLSFEYFATNYANSKGLVSLIKYRNSLSVVNHIGDLESTAREYHMINSISIPVKQGKSDYISGLNRYREITFVNKAGLFIKLYVATIYLSIKLFFSREAYDFAFRIYIASLKRFKH
jgi:hypothetical protein